MDQIAGVGWMTGYNMVNEYEAEYFSWNIFLFGKSNRKKNYHRKDFDWD